MKLTARDIKRFSYDTTNSYKYEKLVRIILLKMKNNDFPPTTLHPVKTFLESAPVRYHVLSDPKFNITNNKIITMSNDTRQIIRNGLIRLSRKYPQLESLEFGI